MLTIWIGSAARSAFHMAEHVHFLENSYTTLTRITLAHEGNLQEMQVLHQANHLLSYYELTPIVSRISYMAEAYNLQKLNFIIGEPVGFDTYTLERLVELNIRMESMGTVYNSLNFLRELQNMPVTISDITLGFGEYLGINLEMSVLSGE